MRVLAGSFCGTQILKRQVAGLHIVETSYAPDESVPWHVHRWPYVTFVLRGGYSEDCGRRTWELAEGDVVLHEAGEAHADRIHAESYLLNLEFTQPWVDRIKGCGPSLQGRINASGGYLLQLGNRLHREAWSDERISSLCIEGLALELIAEVAQARPPASRGSRWLEEAVEYLHAHFCRSPSLQEVADAVGVHPVHLAREFHRRERLTVGEYIRKLRVELACRELARTDRPVVDIALQAGFADHSHLTRVFRAHTGVTPTEFRRLHAPPAAPRAAR
ncbi:MAG TPA: helix-turn-helix domain-containing protein [Vicinamibacterales bacterium]|nr:helix-turn-helix domain-containing protein [Vicinamibacterales bacterium]